ncbi:VOC family protein [Parahaliea mediterranea]|uniref:VOC family protein n=1 Tax=Parahaliea mediterranea TaxID=651086 RepID=A0A939DI87_9GAMM|nr:VOC family protein [Parahaliea mediterranea]MBN7798594.1 VOC family protein [Parahaliea mediterranea]
MANKHGEFIWYELLTEDADAAAAFYSELLGWQVEDSGMPGMDYRLLRMRDGDSGEVHEVGGMMPLSAEMKDGGARPAWLGYIAVDNVDECLQRLVEAGGTVLMPPLDIPEVGRIALLGDPQGAPFYIMRGVGDATSLAFAFDRPRAGHCAWNELVTPEPAAAWSFYGTEFGWTKDGEIPLGELGSYEFIRHNGVIGALMPKPEEVPVPLWNYYFRVPDIDVAIERIRAGGGQVLNGPDEIPGGEFALQGLDPQGAVFALVGARQS